MQEHDVANDSVDDSDAEKIMCGHYKIGVTAATSKEENAPDMRSGPYGIGETARESGSGQRRLDGRWHKHD